MTPKRHEVLFSGEFLQRGFWLYVWEIMPVEGGTLYYVGRTGDSSSTNAQSPFNRMGQHLGFAEQSNPLRRHLEAAGVRPEGCAFRLVAFGPLEAESTATVRDEHDQRRDRIAAMEKALADALVGAGCRLLNTVKSRKPLNQDDFKKVREAFAGAFPRLV